MSDDKTKDSPLKGTITVNLDPIPIHGESFEAGWDAGYKRGEDAATVDIDLLRGRIITIADEAFGPNPVQSADDALTQIERGCFELRKRLGDVEAERDRYRAALEFYANDANYQWYVPVGTGSTTQVEPVMHDRGKRARAALKGSE